MSDQSYWQNIYERSAPEGKSWYQRRPEISLELIEKVAQDSSRLIDVGSGASTLVDHLLAAGGFEITVVDIAPAALEATRGRLGESAEQVSWRTGNLAQKLELGGPFDIWHDRAVFHFMTDEDARRGYLENLERHVASDGHAIISTFGPDGPEKCSGLPICRYAPDQLADTLGAGWHLLESRSEVHRTPGGGEQAFIYGLFERVHG